MTTLVAIFLILHDVDDDGSQDLVSHYLSQETGISPGDTESCLTADLTSGVSIQLCGSIRVKK